jgi:hypothetical protein
LAVVRSASGSGSGRHVSLGAVRAGRLVWEGMTAVLLTETNSAVAGAQAATDGRSAGTTGGRFQSRAREVWCGIWQLCAQSSEARVGANHLGLSDYA